MSVCEFTSESYSAPDRLAAWQDSLGALGLRSSFVKAAHGLHATAFRRESPDGVIVARLGAGPQTLSPAPQSADLPLILMSLEEGAALKVGRHAPCALRRRYRRAAAAGSVGDRLQARHACGRLVGGEHGLPWPQDRFVVFRPSAHPARGRSRRRAGAQPGGGRRKPRNADGDRMGDAHPGARRIAADAVAAAGERQRRRRRHDHARGAAPPHLPDHRALARRSGPDAGACRAGRRHFRTLSAKTVRRHRRQLHPLPAATPAASHPGRTGKSGRTPASPYPRSRFVAASTMPPISAAPSASASACRRALSAGRKPSAWRDRPDRTASAAGRRKR